MDPMAPVIIFIIMTTIIMVIMRFMIELMSIPVWVVDTDPLVCSGNISPSSLFVRSVVPGRYYGVARDPIAPVIIFIIMTTIIMVIMRFIIALMSRD